jgi:PIN domain nuclease of toxin-antitoxin system
MVLDTHTLLWWLSNDPALSSVARERIRACREGRGYLIISGVSLWELEWKRRLGKLALPGSVRPWLPRLRGLRGVLLEGISFELWVAMAELDWAHRDPADRLIAATALEHDVPVLSKDCVFHADDSPVEAVW